MSNGNSGKVIPKKKGFTGKKEKTSDLYMEGGIPCGDMEGIGPRGKGPSGAGAGPKVGGAPMGIHHSFANGIPNEGRENISAEYMKPEHKANVKDSVLDTEEDSEWGGKITPQDFGVHHTFGVS